MTEQVINRKYIYLWYKEHLTESEAILKEYLRDYNLMFNQKEISKRDSEIDEILSFWTDKNPESLKMLINDHQLLKNINLNSQIFFTGEILDLAEQFVRNQPLYYDDARNWWVWNKLTSCWVLVDDTSILVNLKKALARDKDLAVKKKTNIIDALKIIARERAPEKLGSDWIQFKDKIVNFVNGQERKVTPKYFLTNPINWNIGKSLDTPVMDKLFKEWVGEENVISLYELLAYCCISDYPLNVMFFLIGGGRNGKSTFLKLLRKFIGLNNICSTELDVLIDSRFESFKLYKKLVCMMGETNFGVMQKTSLLKKLVGGDLINYEAKGKDPFDGVNYAKLIIASNSLPDSFDTSEGFYRRCFIIDFPNKFEECAKDLVADIPEVEFENLALKVLDIIPKIIFQNGFSNIGSIAERKKKYLENSNPLTIFVEDVCSDEPNKKVFFSEFYTKYAKWLSDKDKRIPSKIEVSKALTKEGFEVRKTSIEGVIGNCVLGLSLKKLDKPPVYDSKKVIDCFGFGKELHFEDFKKMLAWSDDEVQVALFDLMNAKEIFQVKPDVWRLIE